ncbi:MAG: hypothetical protein V1810_02255 [Candidatus Beckwithbacteria bacterium]
MTRQSESEIFSDGQVHGKNTGIRYIRTLLDQALTASDLPHEEKLALAQQFLQAAVSLNRPLHRLGRSAVAIQYGARKLANWYPDLNWPALEQTILLLSQEHRKSISLNQLQLGKLTTLSRTSPEPTSPVLPGLFAKKGQSLLEFFSQLIRVPADNLSLIISGRDGQNHPFESYNALQYSFRYLDIFHLYPEPEPYWPWVNVKNSNINFPLAAVIDQAEPEVSIGSLSLIPQPETTTHKLSLFPEKPLGIISGAELNINWTGPQEIKQALLLALFKSTLDC